MRLTRYEMESIVLYNAEEQTATLYTRDKAVMRKLDTLVADFPDTYKLVKQDEASKTYSFPKSHNHLLADDLIPQAEDGRHGAEGAGKADDD